MTRSPRPRPAGARMLPAERGHAARRTPASAWHVSASHEGVEIGRMPIDRADARPLAIALAGLSGRPEVDRTARVALAAKLERALAEAGRPCPPAAELDFRVCVSQLPQLRLR